MSPAKRLLLLFLILALTVSGRPAFAADSPPATAATNGVVGDVDVRDLTIREIARLAADLSGANVVATTKASEQTVTVFLRNTTVRHLIDNVCRIAGLWHRFDAASNTYLIMTAAEFQRDVVVFRADHSRVLTLKHHNVVSAANAIRALYGTRVVLTEPVEEGLSLSTIGSPLSARRTAAGGRQGSSRSGTGGTLGASAPTAGFGMATAPMGAAARAGSGGPAGVAQAQAPSAALANMSMERMRTVAGATEGTVTRIEGGELEKLDQTRESSIYVTFNRLHNFLMVRSGDEAVVKEIEALVSRLDQPARQVLLEMKVLELSKGDDFESAFDLDFNSGSTATGPASAQPSNPITGTTGATAKNVGSINPFNGINPAGGLIYQFINSRIRARVQLLQTDNRVNVLATPMLLASNNQPSRLFIGEERVLTTGASSTQTSNANTTSTQITVETETRDVGNTLIIVPRINDDNTISLSIDLDASEVRIGGGSVPVGVGDQLLQVPVDVVSTSNLQSTVLAKDGLTVAIGGMIRVAKNRQMNKVPLLGDIPGLGFFFRNETDSKEKSEVVLLITPHVISSAEDGEVRTRERLGTLLSNPAGDMPRLNLPPSSADSSNRLAVPAVPPAGTVVDSKGDPATTHLPILERITP